MRYFVTEKDIGHVIHDETRILPLPFLFCSRSNAQRVCDSFNQFGHREVAEYYYAHKVAGTRDIEAFEKSSKNPYREWMKEHGDMFK